MTLLKQKRTRLVCFRLSMDEYDKLQQLCVASGARCVSDVARSAVRQMLGSTFELSDPGTIPDLLRAIRAVAGDILTTVNRLEDQAGLDPVVSDLVGAVK